MTHIELDLKLKIINLYDDGKYTQKELANHFKISERTLKRWLQYKRNNQELSRKNRAYKSYKV